VSGALARALLVAALSLLASACDRSTDKQLPEDTAARAAQPQPAAAPKPADTPQAVCARVEGTWADDQERCGMTHAMCKHTGAGKWREGTGCIVTAASEAECSGFKGVRWSQETCTVEWLDRDELLQKGL